jgi:hypothetical protein
MTWHKKLILTVDTNADALRASTFHCQIDCQILFDNCHLNFRDAETMQN